MLLKQISNSQMRFIKEANDIYERERERERWRQRETRKDTDRSRHWERDEDEGVESRGRCRERVREKNEGENMWVLRDTWKRKNEIMTSQKKSIGLVL